MVSLPSGHTEVLGPLERELILRRFNIEQLGMEEPMGTDMEKVIGMGKRKHHESGQIRPVVDFYYSYFRKLVRTFETTPIVKYFGLTLKDALSLPVNQWYEIEREAKLLSERQGPDAETRMFELMKEFIGAMSLRTGE